MKYKPGDKVRLKDNLFVGAHYGVGARFMPHMAKYKGKVLTIRKISDYTYPNDVIPGTEYYYVIGETHPMSDRMFESVEGGDVDG